MFRYACMINRIERLTQHAQPPDFVHQEGGDYVARQHSQSPEEVNKVDPVGTVVVIECDLAARLIVCKCAVDHRRADKF